MRVNLFYACQSKVAAAAAHGEDTVKELFGLAKNRLVLRLDGYDDALFASHMLGKSNGYLTLLGKGGPTESAQGRDVADPGFVQNLPLPSPRAPVIRGFGNTPDTGPFHLVYRFRKDLAFLNAAKAVPRLPARPADPFDLQPLSPAERRRLGLR